MTVPARLFVILCLACLAPRVQAGDAGLRARIAGELQRQGLQGAVWATVDAEGAVAVDAAGVRDARSGASMAPDDRVQVGSIAKTLLATGVLHLVSERRVSLDAPLAAMLPGLALDNPWQATDPVRLRHLLDHTAGLDDARLAQIFSLRPTPDTPLADAFREVQPLRVRSRPGTRHSYSNSGYALLGMVIERVTGERYERWLDARVLQPLGMRGSTFAFVTQAGDPRLAMGHFERGQPHAAVPAWLRPSMQFTTTAADMARFARFLMGDGVVGGVRVVDAALLSSMGEPVGTEAAQAGLRVGYGLGLATRDRHGAVGKCHGGNTVGYRAMLCVFPADRRAFFVALNADVEGADYNAIDRALVESLALTAPSLAPAVAMPDGIEAWTGYYVPAPNRFATFAWIDATFGFVRVSRHAQTLVFAPFGGEATMLSPVAPMLFRAPGRVLASHVLARAPDGRRAIGTGLQSYEQTSAWVLAVRWASVLAGLAGFAWLLVAGTLRRPWRRAQRGTPLFVAWLGVVALFAPLPLLWGQSFLQLGDATPGSVLLALVTGALPLAMLAGVWRARRSASRLQRIDAVAMLAVLQCAAALAWQGLLPLRLWA